MPALLNIEHERYAQAIAAGNTQINAWRTAGGSAPSRTYGPIAKNPIVLKRIQELLQERMAMEGITANRTKRELARIGFADIRKLFDKNGDLLPIHELDDDTAAAVASITVEVRQKRLPGGGVEEVVLKKIKFAPKMDALNTLAKHFKIVGDADEGVTQLANALADRLNSAKRRVLNNVEDAEIIEPEQLDVLSDDLADEPPPDLDVEAQTTADDAQVAALLAALEEDEDLS